MKAIVLSLNWEKKLTQKTNSAMQSSELELYVYYSYRK